MANMDISIPAVVDNGTGWVEQDLTGLLIVCSGLIADLKQLTFLLDTDSSSAGGQEVISRSMVRTKAPGRLFRSSAHCVLLESQSSLRLSVDQSCVRKKDLGHRQSKIS